ncbi:hypothetical protein MUK42_22386 [Musa troglodytarum]|uniref:Uncharacterized protein n=1 Tax=Musa troglodytarum TaxID=320322 RepID=A0A9E7K8W4_9LILI|nr:hypothetical protein MUK42_22386 [Musa troglodytarum]
MIASCLISRCQWGAERSTTSSRKIVQVSSSSVGSEPSKTPTVPRDLVQMMEAHNYSSMVTSW